MGYIVTKLASRSSAIQYLIELFWTGYTRIDLLGSSQTVKQNFSYVGTRGIAEEIGGTRSVRGDRLRWSLFSTGSETGSVSCSTRWKLSQEAQPFNAAALPWYKNSKG